MEGAKRLYSVGYSLDEMSGASKSHLQLTSIGRSAIEQGMLKMWEPRSEDVMSKSTTGNEVIAYNSKASIRVEAVGRLKHFLNCTSAEDLD